MYFDAQWCSWCQHYKAETLADTRVQRQLGRDYVAVLVDFDARADLVARYRIRGLPYTWILSPGGETLNGFVGILTPDDLLDVLQLFATRTLPAETAPEGGAQTRVTTLDETGYRAFRAAFLEHVAELYDAEHSTLTRRFETGATLKRPSPLTWMYLAGDERRRERLRALSRTAAAWVQARMAPEAPAELDAELAGLVAWVAQERALYPEIPAAARDWALRQLHIRTDTPPDDLVPGLTAWERALGR